MMESAKKTCKKTTKNKAKAWNRADKSQKVVETGGSNGQGLLGWDLPNTVMPFGQLKDMENTGKVEDQRKNHITYAGKKAAWAENRKKKEKENPEKMITQAFTQFIPSKKAKCKQEAYVGGGKRFHIVM